MPDLPIASSTGEAKYAEHLRGWGIKGDVKRADTRLKLIIRFLEAAKELVENGHTDERGNHTDEFNREVETFHGSASELVSSFNWIKRSFFYLGNREKTVPTINSLGIRERISLVDVAAEDLNINPLGIRAILKEDKARHVMAAIFQIVEYHKKTTEASNWERQTQGKGIGPAHADRNIAERELYRLARKMGMRVTRRKFHTPWARHVGYSDLERLVLERARRVIPEALSSLKRPEPLSISPAGINPHAG